MKHDKISSRNFKIKKKIQDRHDKENNENTQEDLFIGCTRWNNEPCNPNSASTTTVPTMTFSF
jgi:hypothetical protein